MKRFAIVVVLFFKFCEFACAAPPLEAYGKLPGLEQMALSPSGEAYAFVAAIDEKRSLGVVTVEGKVLRVADIGTLKVRHLQWVGDDRLLVTYSATFNHPLDFVHAYELATVMNINVADGAASNVFARAKGIANVVLGAPAMVRTDGSHYGYFVGLELGWSNTGGYVFAGDRRNLYRVDLSTGETTMAAHGGGATNTYNWAIDAQGAVVAHAEYEQARGMQRVYAGPDRQRLLYEQSSPFNVIALAGQGRTPGSVLVEDNRPDPAIVEELSLADGNRVRLFETMSVENRLLDPDTGLLLGATTRESPGAVFFDERLQARFNGTRKAFPGYQMKLISYSRNLDRLIVKTDGGDDSGTYWLVDIASGKAKPIGHPYPQIRAADVAPTQWVTYDASDGLSIHAVLTLPPDRKPEGLPLVVLPHGGPIGISDDIGFDWWAQAFAVMGYAVLQPNYRGSAGYGTAFVQAGFRQWGRKMQTDLSDGVAALATRGLINPKRVCIVGGSYGGYAALAGVTLQQGIYRCAVSVGGPADMATFFYWQSKSHGANSASTRYWRAVTGADTEGMDAMRRISPAQFADQADAPILLLHGKDDTVVPVQQSEAMAEALREAHKPVDMVIMPGEDHWLSRDETRFAMLKAATRFVREHNPL